MKVRLRLCFYCYKQFCKEYTSLCKHTHIFLRQILRKLFFLGQSILQTFNFDGNYQIDPWLYHLGLTNIDSHI